MAACQYVPAPVPGASSEECMGSRRGVAPEQFAKGLVHILSARRPLRNASPEKREVRGVVMQTWVENLN